ncbi:DNA-directed DNA polymerase epsilon, subunit B [Apophysomyces sp. BC1021]|nr:DNA-directed DNA polymerase epsilon, subunit B [Apophysomyces sp. BC1021]
MSDTARQRKISRTIFRVFTKLHGLHMQTDATAYLEEQLMIDKECDIVETLEKYITAYKKKYSDRGIVIVDKASLKDIVTSLQIPETAAGAPTPFKRVEDDINDSLQDMTLNEAETIDVSKHFFVVNAFNMPRLQYDIERKGFVKTSGEQSLLASANEKADMFRDRFNLVKQRLLRNENFCPSSMDLLKKDTYMKITPIMSLIGRDGGRFLLFGMLTQIEDGKLFLEDEDAHVELDVSQCKYGPGLFTDNTFVLVEGEYRADRIFQADEIGFPPAERRELSDTLFSHVDFTGLPRSTVDEHVLKFEEAAHKDIGIVTISDVWLDQPRVMNALRGIFEGYESSSIPLAFILLGNFTSLHFVEPRQYRDNFTTLADLIAEFPSLAAHSYFVFVPGARDPWGNNTLPQAPIPDLFAARMKQKVRRAIFTTNPCRIRYCTQDIVVFRDDILSRLWRNTLLSPQEEEEEDRRKHGHLCPLPLSSRPMYWAFDHAMRLYPLPQAVVLADQCDNYGITYEGTHCMNPGSFPNSQFSWSVYYPAHKTSERCALPTAP